MNALDYAKRYKGPPPMYVCSGCGKTVTERDVDDQTHDTARGGCGRFVVALTREETERHARMHDMPFCRY